MNLGITGHRPDKLWGYRNECPELYIVLWGAIEQIVLEKKPDYLITGMAQGADQLFAEIAIQLSIPFIALVPFKGQETMWPPAAQASYRELLEKAHEVVTVSPGGYAAWKMQRRNKEIVWQSSELIAVWDGSSGGTAHCVAFAEQQKVPIIRINPKELL